jgi:hypothetical protein
VTQVHPFGNGSGIAFSQVIEAFNVPPETLDGQHVQHFGPMGIHRSVFADGLDQTPPGIIVLRTGADKVAHIGRMALDQEVLCDRRIVIGLPFFLEQV